MSPGPLMIDDLYIVYELNAASSELPITKSETQDTFSSGPKSKMAQTCTDSVHHTPIVEVSNSTPGSSRSKSPGVFASGYENISPSRTTSHTTLHSNLRPETHFTELASDEEPTQTGHPDAPRLKSLSVINPDRDDLEGPPAKKILSQTTNQFGEDEDLTDMQPLPSLSVIITSSPPKTLQKIVDSVRRRQFSGPHHLKSSEERQDLGDEFEPQLESREHLEVPLQNEHEQHRKASSGFSSMVSAPYKSDATAPSISSGNINSHKTQSSRSQSRLSRFSKRSSRFSALTNQNSMDSDCGSDLSSHKAATHRALQRRRIIRELIESESGYLDDLRILTYVYLTILGSIPVCDRDKLQKFEVNMLSMIALHEDILKGMKSVAQKSTTAMEGKRTLPRLAKHIRYESIDSLKSVTRRHKSLNRRSLGDQAKDPDLVAEPKEAADVAGIFAKTLGGTANTQMGRFSIYEEYGASFAEMLQACALASQTIPIWEVVERGIEALVNKVFLQRTTPREDRKALAFEDLLIKPIQRICKYPLLFAELESYCPTMDDPESLATITKVLEKLRETAHEVNNATNDLEAQARLRRSQHLEDLLVFPSILRPSFSLIRDLGHATLCGVLFVVYQARGGGIRGDFMLCALFNSYMLLASPGPGYRRFTIGAIIRLSNTQLATASSGRGLQCYDTPYAWKILFEANCRLSELLFCACTELEAERWKSKLQEACTRENQQQIDAKCLSASNLEFLFFETKEYANKSSMERTTDREYVEQPLSNVISQVQVVSITVKNTQALVKGDHAEFQHQAAASANRSRFQATTNDCLTLLAEKNDRIRMEQAMSEVWTRDSLPFPGMRTSRSGQLIRASASMMRKLSKTSITSTPSKRSASQRSHISTIGLGLDGAMDDPFVDHPAGNSQAGFEPANPATQKAASPDRPSTQESRKISFSSVPTRAERNHAHDDGSDTSTVVGNNSARNANRPRKKKSLARALSRERIRGWFM